MLNKKISSFLLVSISLISLVTSCGGSEDVINGVDISKKTYSDYKEFHLKTLDEFYSLEGTYSVQLYYETCPSCKNVQPYLFRHLENLKAGNKQFKTYIFDMKRKGGDTLEEAIINRSKFKPVDSNKTKEQMINEMINNKASSLKDTYFFGVPALYVVKDNKLSEFHYDSNNVSDFYRYLN